MNIYKLISYPKKEWNKFINAENKHLCSDEAIDFLSKTLVYDHVFILFHSRPWELHQKMLWIIPTLHP